MRYTLHRGDCIEAMRGMANASVDAIVTDPPYHLTNAGGGPAGKGQDTPFARARAGASSTGFMGQEWDGGDIAFQAETWREALRVLKPGGHLLAFGGSRTYHRLAAAIEDAGFEIRDQIMWLYGSGFPKSHNLDGAWEGWGTALKPAHEPICVARKPLAGTAAQNVLTHGTGALNIDGCRVAPTGERLGGGDENGKASKPEGWARPWMDDPEHVAAHNAKVRSNVEKATELGRWPANVIHDGSPEVVAAFPQASGAQSAVKGTEASAKTANTFGEFGGRAPSDRRDGGGSAARFFYCAKASRADRNEGLDGLPDRVGGMNSNTSGQHITRRDGWTPEPVKNHHPTVKPTDLMQYLCRLVTPPGGLVLDPFMGSGSTGKAAILEGFRFVGCELQPEYIEIARARIQHAAAAEQHQYELEIA